jgi:small subunit ribosomal protein S6
VRDYELMCVLNPELDEAGQEAQHERLKTLIAARNGDEVNVEPWGRRRLAYSIKGFRDGLYVLTRFKMSPTEADVLERNLRLTDSVIRHLLIRPNAD